MAFSIQRVVIMNKTPAFLFTQLGWNKDNVQRSHRGARCPYAGVQDQRGLRADPRAEPDGHRGRLGCREEGRHGQRGQWRPRQRLAEDPLGYLRPLQAGVVESQRVGDDGGQSRLPSRPGKDEARWSFSTCPNQVRGGCSWKKAISTSRSAYWPDPFKPLAGNKDIKVESFPYSGTLVHPDSAWPTTAAEENQKIHGEAAKYLVDYHGIANGFLKAASRCTRHSCR